MDLEQSDGSGHVSWTSSMSAYMLTNLADVVGSGTRTSSGFKKVHLNACARALNDHFKLKLTGDQIGNHVRTWKRKWAKIVGLKNNLSAALWDEDNCIIGLDHEHYAEHIKTHKGDAEYLNKPIEYYQEMAAIFGNSLATGKYAKGSNEPLATDVTEIEDDVGTNDGDGTHSTNVGESSASKSKKAKTTCEEESLVATIRYGCDRLAAAIEKSGDTDNELPEGLWDNMKNIPGFSQTHLSHYYAYLVENVRIARAFNSLDFDNKLTWVARYISNHFHE